MTYSKIFSGDLPELTNEIIHYFKGDSSTLYSCILVNRLWCRLAIPLLWEDPFSLPTQNYRYIEIYLSYLNEVSKAKFNEYDILNRSLSSNTLLFNYPNFIKYLNVDSVYNSTKKWISSKKWISTALSNNLGSLVSLLNKNKKLVSLTYRSLFEVLIKNEGILHSFEVEISKKGHYGCFSDTIKLFSRSPNFLYNIRNLKFIFCNISFRNTMIIPFLEVLLYSNCNSISLIVLNFPIYYDIKNFSLIEKCLSKLIISQHNLKIISFECHTILYKPFLSLKNSHCSNTLNTIIFDCIDFKSIITILKEVFDQLNVLESIHILYCGSLNSDFVQQIINVIKPFKLKTLFMKEILHIESLQFLLQKCGNYLENFEFTSMSKEYEESRRQLLKFIIKYCPNIKRFTSDNPDDINIYQIIENIGKTINYLNIDLNGNDYDELLSPIILQNLGQVLPSKLEYLCLSLSFNKINFEIFLRNSQNTFIKKLLIRNMLKNLGEGILFYIKEYIMKKERVKYLAYSISYFDDDTDRELFYLDDEVNEFKLHNIIVQKYFDLYINIKDIICNFNV